MDSKKVESVSLADTFPNIDIIFCFIIRLSSKSLNIEVFESCIVLGNFHGYG